MVTQEGKNVHVCAVEGNFDDAQTGVKRIFGDDAFAKELAEKGYVLSSANSINWGRLVPQVAYYFSAYADLLARGEIIMGDEVNFCVPTGNFGNILAAYYAKRMGLPVGRLVCASNSNNVLFDFIEQGVYNANRPFHKTTSLRYPRRRWSRPLRPRWTSWCPPTWNACSTSCAAGRTGR